MEQIEETKGVQLSQESSNQQDTNKQLFAKLDSFLRGYNRQSIKITTLQKKIPLDIDTINNWLKYIDKQSQLTGSGNNLILNNFYKSAKESSINTNTSKKQQVTNTSNKINASKRSLSKNQVQDIQLQLSNLTTQLDIVLQQELSLSSDNMTDSLSQRFDQNTLKINDIEEHNPDKSVTGFAIETGIKNNQDFNDRQLKENVQQSGVQSIDNNLNQFQKQISQKNDQVQNGQILSSKPIKSTTLPIGPSDAIRDHSIAYLVNELCETDNSIPLIKFDQSENNDQQETIMQQSTDKQQQLILQSMYKEFLFDDDNDSDWKTMFKQDVEFCIMKSSQGLYYNQIQYFLNDPELNQYKFNNVIFQIIYICLQLLIQQKTEKEHRDNIFHMNLRKMMTGITTDQRSNDVINSVLEILKNTSNNSPIR